MYGKTEKWEMWTLNQNEKMQFVVIIHDYKISHITLMEIIKDFVKAEIESEGMIL